ncbi:ABC transporter permease [Anaerotignum sp.]|uniref:ABC transporter permease n=1 Tax=Anaerotignum sp. TaxID=2039241 RepID=UPI0027145331|nr:ABC transporter permease [Anaerotignum sp.]
MIAAFRLFFREWFYLLKRPRSLIILILIPIFVTGICGVSFENGSFTHLKMGIVDYSYSAKTREVVDAFQQSEYFDVIGYYENEDQVETAMKDGEIVGCIIFPADFTKNVMQGRQAQVLLGSCAVNMGYGSTINLRGAEILGTLSTQMAVKGLVAKGYTVDDAVAKMNPVSFYIRQWYNPTNNFGYFLTFGFVIATLQQVLVYFAAISLAREKESGKLGEIKGVNPIFQVIIKALVYYIISMGVWMVCAWMMVNKFGIPMKGSFDVWFAYSSLFILSIIAMGQFFSAVMPNPVFATSVSLAFTSPSLVFSGFTWPTMAFTGFYQKLAQVFPLTHFVIGYRNVALIGCGFDAIREEMIGLAGISGGCLFLSCVVWYIKLKLIEKKQQALETPVDQETAQAVAQ